MKFNRKFVSLIMALLMVLNFSIVGSISAFAHETMLEVSYDDCIPANGSDGIDEMWYVLTHGTCYHFPHNVDTVTYRFMGESDDWIPEGMTEDVGEQTKAIYANSMEKWNNVYFYTYNPDGTISKNKLINVVQITEGNANISIYPTNSQDSDIEGAITIPIGRDHTIQHEHITNWEMTINIELFYENTPLTNLLHLTSEDIALAREYTGAHELAHVLGLFDLDNLCNADTSQMHHHEVLTGYGFPVCDRSGDITYKDIAGVAITRGFHTDEDHRWLDMGQQSDGTYKLLCSICNGVKYVDSLEGYSYSSYGACEGDHDNLLYGNMIAVASYGDQDYYKCGYCRYVAPFSAIIDQNYEKTPFSNDLHKCKNDVPGLRYTFYEEHSYDTCEYLNLFSHKNICACGRIETSAHYIYGSEHVGEDYAPCGGCGYLLDLHNGNYEHIMSITQVSVNGSYIRSDGIVVLVDEDIEAYLAGTLQFYHPANLPVTQ